VSDVKGAWKETNRKSLKKFLRKKPSISLFKEHSRKVKNKNSVFGIV
jgi:hypothetical protein